MKVSVVIPARYESTRFPGKPLIQIDGMSLLQRTYQRVEKCPSVDTIVVATDDDRIKDLVHAFGGNVCMTSPLCPTGTDRVGEACRLSPLLQDSNIIINVQGDEPCINPETIEKVIHVLQSDPDIDIATAVSPITSDKDLHSPNVVKCVLSKSQRILYFSRYPIPGNKKLHSSIAKSHIYMRHIGIYGFRPESLMHFIALDETPLQKEEDIEAIRALENDMMIAACQVEHHAPGVDVPEDVLLVQTWLAQEKRNTTQYHT